jgi:hypothetical protein
MFWKYENLKRLFGCKKEDPFKIPKEDWFKLSEDNPLCKEYGHMRVMEWPKEEDWWSGTIGGDHCFRCGWSDPCIWT